MFGIDLGLGRLRFSHAELLLTALLLPLSACNSASNGNGNGNDCTDLKCRVNLNCPAISGPTTLTGVVSIPAGTLPVYNAKVYIPSGAIPPPPKTGVSCERCEQVVPADSIASATTDLNGNFTLTNVPSGDNIPLVIQVGKWRREIKISNVAECATTPLRAEDTHLPRKKSEGNIPKFALTSGNQDALECLLRKVGIDDSEFTNPDRDGRVNLYVGNGIQTYDKGFNGQSDYVDFGSATDLWSSLDNLSKYDVLMLSCESEWNTATKSAAAHKALQDYIDQGGRVFASHFHNVWIAQAGASLPMSKVAQFAGDKLGYYDTSNSKKTALINMSTLKGRTLATWLQSSLVQGTTTLGELDVYESRATLHFRDQTLTQDFVDFGHADVTAYNDKLAIDSPDRVLNPGAQYFSFNAPIGAVPENQCGQMVFTDLHLKGGPSAEYTGLLPFPLSCGDEYKHEPFPLTPQQKALIFLLFDLTNCLDPVVG